MRRLAKNVIKRMGEAELRIELGKKIDENIALRAENEKLREALDKAEGEIRYVKRLESIADSIRAALKEGE